MQCVLGSARVLKDAGETNIKQKIESSVPLMTFMVNHAATIINRCSVDQDGRNPLGHAEPVRK